MSKQKLVKTIKGPKTGRTATVKLTEFRRKRKDGVKGKLQKRFCVAVTGPDIKPPAFMRKHGVTKGVRAGGCFSANGEGKKKALAAAARLATTKKL